MRARRQAGAKQHVEHTQTKPPERAGGERQEKCRHEQNGCKAVPQDEGERSPDAKRLHPRGDVGRRTAASRPNRRSATRNAIAAISFGSNSSFAHEARLDGVDLGEAT